MDRINTVFLNGKIGGDQAKATAAVAIKMHMPARALLLLLLLATRRIQQLPLLLPIMTALLLPTWMALFLRVLLWNGHPLQRRKSKTSNQSGRPNIVPLPLMRKTLSLGILRKTNESNYKR
jgi:hypothetical protein